tara:strand:+ start:10948 stop:11739 length:792 start_codon:yes stop_codon:yes gene_type:complete
MSDNGNESDSSIGTDELNELNSKLDEQLKNKAEQNLPATENTVVEKDLPPPKKEVKKKREMTQAQKDGLAKGRAKALENRKKKLAEKQASKPIPIPQPEPAPEPAPVIAYSPPEKVKKKGRPPKPLEEKLAKQVITKEKVIYVIQDENGNLIKKDPNKISAKEMKKIKAEEEAQKKELELGKKLGRLKNGSAKIPKPRTEKQIEHTKRLIEKNKERRGKKSVEKKEQTKEIVKEAVKEVVREPAQPAPKPQKSIEQQYNDFFS